MMTVNSLRILFVLICCTVGYLAAEPQHRIQGVVIGFILSILAFAHGVHHPQSGHPGPVGRLWGSRSG
jgi:hypothetical protein